MFHVKPHQMWLLLRARRFKKTHVYFILHFFVDHALQYNITNHKMFLPVLSFLDVSLLLTGRARILLFAIS